jgi:hypothetical protein
VRGRRVATTLLALAACRGEQPRPPRAKPSLAVIGFDAPGDARAHAVAAALTDALRALVAGRDSRFELAVRGEDLPELEELASCPDRAAPSCLADIGAFLDVDYLIYGKLEARGDGFAVTVELLDVAHRFNRRAYFAPAVADPRVAAKDAFARLATSW